MNENKMLKTINDSILLTHHMGISVKVCSLSNLVIQADFHLNKNHKSTAFGGSLATTLTLACWAWLTNYLDENQLQGFEVSVHRCHIEYIKPVLTDFDSVCEGASAEDLASFQKTLLRKGRARLKLKSFVPSGGVYTNGLQGESLVNFEGEFVAYRDFKS